MNSHDIQGLNKPKRGSKICHQCKYKMRWFYSKGAFLVLVWVILCSMTATLACRIIEEVSADGYVPSWLIAIPLLITCVAALPLGWLANTKIGVYNTTKYGMILMFLSTFLVSVSTLFFDFDFVKNHPQIMGYLICLVLGIFFTIGMEAFIVSVLQLGLDQMPDASSSNITSFIAWLIFSIFVSV